MNIFSAYQDMGLIVDDRLFEPLTAAEEKLRAAEDKFLASLRAARAKVIADGLEVLLKAHDYTIGDDPQFGLPKATRRA